MTGSFAYSYYQDAPLGTFTEGFVFVNAPDLAGAELDGGSGYWHCDIARDDKLTWSENVYALFGLPPAAPVVRDWAVARYTEPSKSNLQRVRSYALKRKLGFILDAAIRREGGGHQWIRILAIPIVSKKSGRVVAVHGLKRSL